MKQKILRRRFIKSQKLSLLVNCILIFLRFQTVGAEYRCLLESIKYVFCVFIELKEAFLRQ